MQHDHGIKFHGERHGAPTCDDGKFEDIEAVSTRRRAVPRCAEEGQILKRPQMKAATPAKGVELRY